jgi:hypothetical protein
MRLKRYGRGTETPTLSRSGISQKDFAKPLAPVLRPQKQTRPNFDTCHFVSTVKNKTRRWQNCQRS